MTTRPVGGTDYPRTRQEFRTFFPDEDACLDFLTRLRWPSGFACPHCGKDGWRSARRRWTCRGCGSQTSLTAGTIFEGTRKPLLDWFEVAWRITTSKNGVSALAVSSEWGLSREAAWTWLHKFRRAMVRPEREPLSGTGRDRRDLRGRGRAWRRRAADLYEGHRGHRRRAPRCWALWAHQARSRARQDGGHPAPVRARQRQARLDRHHRRA